MRYQIVAADSGLWADVSSDGVEEHTLFDARETAEYAALLLTVMYRRHRDPSPDVVVVERPDLHPRAEVEAALGQFFGDEPTDGRFGDKSRPITHSGHGGPATEEART